MLSAPPRLLTFVVVMAGVLSNTASEVGYVLLVPLSAIIFLAVGRHPIAGLAAAFVGIAYGLGAKTPKSDADVTQGVGDAMSTLGICMVLVFFAAQFVAYFKWTNLGPIFGFPLGPGSPMFVTPGG